MGSLQQDLKNISIKETRFYGYNLGAGFAYQLPNKHLLKITASFDNLVYPYEKRGASDKMENFSAKLGYCF